MEFFETIRKRRSIRKFEKCEIEEEKLQKILEAANISPSAGNLQGYEIIVVKEKMRKEALKEAARGQGFISEAPVVLVFCANGPRSSAKYEQRGEKLYSIQDATIACSYAQLAATDLGLGSVWVGAFDNKLADDIVKAPEGVRSVAILPLGYYLKDPPARPRRPLDDLVKAEHY